MTFWEIGVGLWSTAHFVYNSGGFRGGAWEARAPLLFLDQTEAAPEGSKKFFWRPGPPYLRVWMTLSSISFVLLQQIQQNITLWLSVV